MSMLLQPNEYDWGFLDGEIRALALGAGMESSTEGQPPKYY
jgi:hypothetical protein